MRPATSIYTKVSVVSCHPFYKKTSTFSFKDLRKTLSQNVMSSELFADRANIERFFGKNNTHRGIARAITKNDKFISVVA